MRSRFLGGYRSPSQCAGTHVGWFYFTVLLCCCQRIFTRWMHYLRYGYFSISTGISAPLRDRKRKGAFLYVVSFRRSHGLCRNRAPLCGNSPGIDAESLLPKLPANGFSFFYFPFLSVPDRQISGIAAVVRDHGSLAIYQTFPFRVWKMTEKQRQKATPRYGFMRWADLFRSDADALLSEWETMVFEKIHSNVISLRNRTLCIWGRWNNRFSAAKGGVRSQMDRSGEVSDMKSRIYSGFHTVPFAEAKHWNRYPPVSKRSGERSGSVLGGLRPMKTALTWTIRYFNRS